MTKITVSTLSRNSSNIVRSETPVFGKWLYVNSSDINLGCNVFYQPESQVLRFYKLVNDRLEDYSQLNLSSSIDIPSFINVNPLYVDSLCSKFYIRGNAVRIMPGNTSVHLIKQFPLHLNNAYGVSADINYIMNGNYSHR